jgi:transposase
MHHIAIDLGGRKSQICVRDAAGKILQEKACSTHDITMHLPEGPGRVILESCSEAFAIAEQVRSRGLEAVVVPAVLAPQLGVGQRGVKTDVRDARALSEMSCRMETLPRVHVPSPRSRERKSMLAGRDVLVETRTALINSVRGWMRTELLKVKSGSAETFAERARATCLSRPAGLPQFIEGQLQVIEHLNRTISESTRELERISQEDPVTRRLRSVPGVGPITALAFASSVDEVERFDSASSIASYFGLTPGEHSSGGRLQRLGISKAGAARTRRALVQASWVLWRNRPNDPNVLWAKQIAQRRGNQKAVVALARKLARILYALWRDGTTYTGSGGRGDQRSVS